MTSAGNKKRFGLILASARREQAARSVAGAGVLRRLNPLRDSDEELEAEDGHQQQHEDEEDAMDWVQASLKKSGGGNSAQLAQQQRLMREALAEDASVFQYDELYDDMQAGRDTAKQEKKQQEKKPKFIHNILKSAERRKLEKERRTERKVQREREEEKGLYDDKESFVTPAYIAKLEELRQAEARERIEALVEEKNDVAKHKNMGLFYQHIFKQRMGEASTPALVKTEPPEGEAKENEEVPNAHDTPSVNKDDTINSASLNKDITIRGRDQRSRANKYRAQRDIDDSPTKEEESPPHSSRRSQKTEREESFDSSDSEPERRRRTDKRKASSLSASPEGGLKLRSPVKNIPSAGTKSQSSNDFSQSPSNSKSTSSRNKIEERTKIKVEPGSSSDEVDDSKDTKENGKKSEEKRVESKESREERIKKLFTKRCVGQKFIEAQQRYLQRRAERSGSGAKGL